jgi:hypothetical protein
MTYQFDTGELKELQIAGVRRRQFGMPVFETLRTTGTDECLLPTSERRRIDREEPRRGRLSWVDLFLELRLAAKVDPRRAPVREIVVTDLLEDLGNPATLAQLRTALQDRYGASVVAAAFDALRITSLADFRDRAPRFVRFLTDPPAPFDPLDPANSRTFPLCVCLRGEDELHVVENLRAAKLSRSVLEHERQHAETFDGGEIRRPYAFVTVYPDAAVDGESIPGLTAAQAQQRVRELFAAEEMAAHFVAD